MRTKLFVAWSRSSHPLLKVLQEGIFAACRAVIHPALERVTKVILRSFRVIGKEGRKERRLFAPFPSCAVLKPKASINKAQTDDWKMSFVGLFASKSNMLYLHKPLTLFFIPKRERNFTLSASFDK